MIYNLLAILSAVLIAGNFTATKIYQKRMGTAVREGALFNSVVGLISSCLFLVSAGFKLEFTLYSFIMALLTSILVGTYTMIGFKIMSLGSVTVYTVFVMLGGAVVPYIYGVLFLGEGITVWKVLAILAVAAAVILNSAGSGSDRRSKYFIPLCIAVFFINGAVSVISKLHQIETVYPVVSSRDFTVIKDFIRFLIFFIVFLCQRHSMEQNDKKLNAKMYIAMAVSAIFSGGAFFLMFICASYMPASVLYPVVTGGTIISMALVDRLFFRQRLSVNTIISIFICIMALVLFVI